MSISKALMMSTVAFALSACGDNDNDNNNVTPPPTTTPSLDYVRVDLVTDQNDPDLVNPWGITTGPAGFWIADNATGTSSIYDGAGHQIAGSGTFTLGEGVTGVTLNPTGAFLVNGVAAIFVFVRQDGALIAWNDKTAPLGTVVRLSAKPDASFTGVTYARDTNNQDRLYVANFGSHSVDVYDDRFEPMAVSGGFFDQTLPAGYSPFNVMALADSIYVAYALPDSAGDETHGAGLGIVDRFDAVGNFIERVAAGGLLNAPWGLALAPSDFGRFSNALLVGNFGDGAITAYDANGTVLGQLSDVNGTPLAIDGLWGITFGDDVASGKGNVLYFVAGTGNEEHGLYGRIEVAGTVY